MIRRIWMFLVAGVALITALSAAWVAESQYETLIATTELVVPVVDIPPYTLVAPALLTTRSVPAPLANEPVYHTAADVAGKIARVPLAAGRLIYVDQAVSPARFRYTDDERLEVLSFPVAPEQAVGGQIKAGMRINLYRVALPNGSPALPGNLNAVAPLTPTPRPLVPAVRVELLAGSVPVVDVRASGGAAMQAPPAPPRPDAPANFAGPATPAPAAGSADKPLTIITVAVPPDTAREIVQLMGELRAQYILWVSLTPLNDAK